MAGSAAIRLQGVESLIADSAAFRARIPVADAAAAKQRIYYGEQAVTAALAAGGTLKDQRPGVVLCLDRHGYVQIGEGSRITLGGTGGVCAIFADNPKFPSDHKASYLDFVDWVSTVIDELSLEVGRNTNWPVRSIELVAEPWRPDVAARKSDDFWITGYLFSDHVNQEGG